MRGALCPLMHLTALLKQEWVTVATPYLPPGKGEPPAEDRREYDGIGRSGPHP